MSLKALVICISGGENMDLFVSILTLVGIVALIVGLIWLIVNLVRKKPLRVPGIVSAAGALLVIVGSLAITAIEQQVNTTEDTTYSAESASSSESESSESKVYGLNEQYKNDMYGLKITQADQNFDDHGMSLVNGDIPTLKVSQKNGIQITVDYENIDSSEGFLPSIWNFKVYDDDGKTGEIINQQEGQDEVSKGHIGTTHFWVNLQKPYADTKYIEVEYGDIQFKINLNH